MHGSHLCDCWKGSDSCCLRWTCMYTSVVTTKAVSSAFFWTCIAAVDSAVIPPPQTSVLTQETCPNNASYSRIRNPNNLTAGRHELPFQRSSRECWAYHQEDVVYPILSVCNPRFKSQTLSVCLRIDATGDLGPFEKYNWRETVEVVLHAVMPCGRRHIRSMVMLHRAATR